MSRSNNHLNSNEAYELFVGVGTINRASKLIRKIDIKTIEPQDYIRASSDKDDFYTIEITMNNGDVITEYFEPANFPEYLWENGITAEEMRNERYAELVSLLT